MKKSSEVNIQRKNSQDVKDSNEIITVERKSKEDKKDGQDSYQTVDVSNLSRYCKSSTVESKSAYSSDYLLNDCDIRFTHSEYTPTEDYKETQSMSKDLKKNKLEDYEEKDHLENISKALANINSILEKKEEQKMIQAKLELQSYQIIQIRDEFNIEYK